MPVCCVSRCKNQTNRKPIFGFYRVPAGIDPFLVNKRLLWEEAIQKANGGKQELVANAHVCAAHFISGEASLDFDSPDFVPSVFPGDPEWKSCSERYKALLAESEAAPRGRKIRLQENETGTKRITRSQEKFNHSQERHNPPKKARYYIPRPKKGLKTSESNKDESAPDLQTSPLREALDELKEEEAPSSPPEQKDEETLIKDGDADSEKVTFDSQTASPQNRISPSAPIDVTAQVQSRPVVRLKRLFAPMGGFWCDKCNETFISTSLLIEHKKLHEEKPSYMCEICGISFTVQKEFAEHQGNHPSIEPDFPCNICGRSFSTVAQLKRHKLLHVKDDRKCLKCGTLFCRRHNHVSFLPKVKSEPEEHGEEKEEAAVEETQKVNVSYDFIKTEETTMEIEPSPTTETVTPSSPQSAKLIIPTANCSLVAVSVLPVLEFVRDNLKVLAPKRLAPLEIAKPAAEPSPVSSPPPPPPLPPPPPAADPPPPRPQISIVTNGGIHSIVPKKEAPSPPSEDFLPSDCSEFPPSLKMFSPRNLTSALLEVKRNYEYIFNKPKGFKGTLKKEAPETLPVSLERKSVKKESRQRIAYDLEIVL
ncbi:unnamed protein product [Ophioblennius macclurei]